MKEKEKQAAREINAFPGNNGYQEWLSAEQERDRAERIRRRFELQADPNPELHAAVSREIARAMVAEALRG